MRNSELPAAPCQHGVAGNVRTQGNRQECPGYANRPWVNYVPSTAVDFRTNPLGHRYGWMLLLLEGFCRDKCYCWYSNAELAKAYGCSVSALENLLREMDRKEIIHRVETEEGRHGRVGLILRKRLNSDLPTASKAELPHVVEQLKARKFEHQSRHQGPAILPLPAASSPQKTGGSAPRKLGASSPQKTGGELSISVLKEKPRESSSSEPVAPSEKIDADDPSLRSWESNAVEAVVPFFAGDLDAARAFVQAKAIDAVNVLGARVDLYAAAVRKAFTVKNGPKDSDKLHSYVLAIIRNGSVSHGSPAPVQLARPAAPTRPELAPPPSRAAALEHSAEDLEQLGRWATGADGPTLEALAKKTLAQLGTVDIGSDSP